MSVHPLPRPGTVALGEATATFLERFRQQPTTRHTYADTLAALETAAGTPAAPVDAAFTPTTAAAAMTRWDSCAPATWNKHLAALRSFAAYAARQEWITVDPTRFLERRTNPARGDKAIPAAHLEILFTDDRVRLREKVLWRMLYDTAARAEEILTLNVDDLDMPMRRARIRSKGGAVEYVHWATATARILPRLLHGRTTGPVFLADPRPPAPVPAPWTTSTPPPGADGCPTRERSICSSRRPSVTTHTGRDGRCTSCATRR